MLHSIFHTAVSLRGQTWLGFNKWSAFLPQVRTIGGIFRFPMPPKA